MGYLYPHPEPTAKSGKYKYYGDYFNQYYYHNKKNMIDNKLDSQHLFLPQIYEPLSPSFEGYNQNIEYIFGAIFLFLLIIIGLFLWCIVCVITSTIISLKTIKKKEQPQEYNQI